MEAEPQPYRTTVEDDGRVVVLVVTGEIDLAVKEQFWAACEGALAFGRPLVIDLLGTTYLDSSGLEVIVRAARRVGDAGRVHLRCVSPLIRRVLEITGVDRVVAVDPPDARH